MEQNLPPLPQVIFENGLYYVLRGEQYYPCLLPPELGHHRGQAVGNHYHVRWQRHRASTRT